MPTNGLSLNKFIKIRQERTLNIMFGMTERLGTCVSYKLITSKLKWHRTNKKEPHLIVGLYFVNEDILLSIFYHVAQAVPPEPWYMLTALSRYS